MIFGLKFDGYSEALGTLFHSFATLKINLEIDEFSMQNLILSRAGGQGDLPRFAPLSQRLQTPEQ